MVEICRIFNNVLAHLMVMETFARDRGVRVTRKKGATLSDDER